MLLDRLARGWALTKASLHVLRLDSEILVLPVLSGVVMLLLASGLMLPLALAALGGGADPGFAVFALAFLLVYFLGYFVVVFFNAAVVAMATIRFEGGDPVVRDGLRIAGQRWAVILKWALFGATVGLLLRMLRGQAQRRYGLLGGVLLGGLEVAWNVLIYFVVPLLIYRGLGPLAALRESAGLVRRTWAEALGGEVSMGFVFVGLGLVGFLVFLAAPFSGSLVTMVVLMVGAVLYWVVLAVVYSAAQGVLTAALYRFATTGQVPQGFDRATLQRAVA